MLALSFQVAKAWGGGLGGGEPKRSGSLDQLVLKQRDTDGVQKWQETGMIIGIVVVVESLRSRSEAETKPPQMIMKL